MSNPDNLRSAMASYYDQFLSGNQNIIFSVPYLDAFGTGIKTFAEEGLLFTMVFSFCTVLYAVLVDNLIVFEACLWDCHIPPNKSGRDVFCNFKITFSAVDIIMLSSHFYLRLNLHIIVPS